MSNNNIIFDVDPTAWSSVKDPLQLEPGSSWIDTRWMAIGGADVSHVEKHHHEVAVPDKSGVLEFDDGCRIEVRRRRLEVVEA